MNKTSRTEGSLLIRGPRSTVETPILIGNKAGTKEGSKLCLFIVSLQVFNPIQIQQSSLDLSTELTSSGSVNATTKSGTNHLHGEGYY